MFAVLSTVICKLAGNQRAFVSRLLRAVCVLLVLAGCSERSTAPAADTQAQAEVAGSSPVLATVNGAAITGSDVDLSIERTFSQSQQLLDNRDVRDKVLKSLVASRALRQQAQKTLDAEALDRIHRQALAYEEELLVKAYLQENTVPEPVTTQMVEEYYRQHPERFGGETVKVFELLRMDHKPTEKERDALLAKVDLFQSSADWKARSPKWKTQFGLLYQTGEAHAGLLEKPLASTLASLTKGQTSGVIFVGAIPHILRVTDVRKLPAKPLSEVSGRIRKTLAPMQMRKAVKVVADAAVAAADVSYKE